MFASIAVHKLCGTKRYVKMSEFNRLMMVKSSYNSRNVTLDALGTDR